MGRRCLSPDNALFVLLAFEGPDAYSRAGGLGVRVTELSLALAEHGFPVHLLFVGDPHLPGVESRQDGLLVLHRWCQWISRYYPGGVYHGEEDKARDFSHSAPWFVAESIVRPAAESGRLPVVMAEEWQTAEAICELSDLLWRAGLRDRAVLLWNANNTMGFHRIDWRRLAFTTTITTVSRYMKHLMWDYGVNPLVIPNGVPRRLLRAQDDRSARELRRSVPAETMLVKVARWDPDKRWRMAVESLARLKRLGRQATLVARGGVEPHGGEVLDHARSLGLRVRDVAVDEQRPDAYAEALGAACPADVLNVQSAISQEMLQLFYQCADVVLANSGREPFGLVGLETMAAGGIAFTGQTGEEYVSHLHNAIVLDTDDPAEATWYVEYLADRPDEQLRLRRSARETAQNFVWDRVVENLLARVEFLAAQQGALPAINQRAVKPSAIPAEPIAADEVRPAIPEPALL